MVALWLFLRKDNSFDIVVAAKEQEFEPNLRQWATAQPNRKAMSIGTEFSIGEVV